MLTYRYTLLAFLGLALLCLIWLAATREDRKVKEGGLVKTLLVLLVLTTGLGAAGLLYREPYDLLSAFSLGLIVCVAVAGYAWWYWDKRHLLQLEDRDLLSWELPRAALIAWLAATFLLHALWATELPRYRTVTGPMLLIAPLPLLLLLPLTVVTAYRYFLRIPIVKRYFEHWTLSVQETPPVIEPTNDARRVYFRIAEEEGGKETVDIDINAPNDELLSTIFHHILYRNVRDRRARTIQVAHQNKKDFMYGWLLYREEPRWWWRPRRVYLDMNAPIRHADLPAEAVVFAERVRPWTFKH